jgi:hypothetical protein
MEVMTMGNNQQPNEREWKANAEKTSRTSASSNRFETELAKEQNIQATELSKAQKEDQNSWYAGE